MKRFFNEKEVTSTLVMDALFSGCKQVEEASRAGIGPKVCHHINSVHPCSAFRVNHSHMLHLCALLAVVHQTENIAFGYMPGSFAYYLYTAPSAAAMPLQQLSNGRSRTTHSLMY